jgi:hypothetical protein
MRIMLGTIALATIIVAGQQSPAHFDPVGKWTYETQNEQGGTITGSIEITGSPGAYKGTILSSDGAQIPVVEVMTSPRGMMLLGDLADGSVVVRVLKDSSGTLTATWGPVRPVITAKVTRAK